MDQFEFFGVAGGNAVVRHRSEGHVFRFAPMHAVGWDALALRGIERGETTTDDPDMHIEEARRFAADAVLTTLGRQPDEAAPTRRWRLL